MYVDSMFLVLNPGPQSFPFYQPLVTWNMFFFSFSTFLFVLQ